MLPRYPRKTTFQDISYHSTKSVLKVHKKEIKKERMARKLENIIGRPSLKEYKTL